MTVIASEHLKSPSRPRSHFRVRSTLFFLLAVTALGCLFRFSFLAHPTLWNDEALTFSRTCGTYDQMLDVLREDGFGPLHYEIVWLLAQHFHMTPFMMRLWPAVAGTLMIPAIYLLGFELLGRRVARLSAILAACSAFLLVYSRDAKMYMPLWLAITLNVGCLLWWMRTGRWTAWLGSVGAGCLACGYHITGLSVIALDILIGLTGPQLTWRRSLLLALGVMLMLAGPIGYAFKFNELRTHVDQYGWEATRIGWVARRTNGHDGSALIADSAGAMIFAFSFVDEPQVRVHVPPLLMGSAVAFLALFSAILACGFIPWRKRAPTDVTPSSDLNHWRVALWLAIWILVPAYGFYRATVPIASTWIDWGQSLCQTLTDHHLYLWLIPALACAAALARYRQIRLVLAVLAAVLLIWSVAVPVARAMLTDDFSTVHPPSWLWLHPIAPIAAGVLLLVIAWTGSARPLRHRLIVAAGILLSVVIVLSLFQAIDMATAGMELHPIMMPRYFGFVSPALIVTIAALLARIPFRPLRWTIFASLLAVNLTQAGARIFASSEPPVDITAADVIAASDSNGKILAFTPDPSPTHGPPTAGSIQDCCGEYYLFTLSRKPVTPAEFRSYNVQAFFPLQETSDPSSIITSLTPQVQRVIVWDGLDTDEPVPTEDLLPKLGEPWREESQGIYPIRNFWDWGELYAYRRRVYVR